jgi:two-component system response regulator YesN
LLYKVFLVEDEYVAREGIRESVNWETAGFEFCGEAPDGEVALPMIDECQPNVLITDIQMPHMDGLQLCRIVRERLPWVKIIILTGYDEFEYAQQAVKLGVTEFLLKPVGAQELTHVLQKVAAKLEQEKEQEASLQKLRDQVEHNQAHLKENFLLKLVMGAVSSLEAIEKSQILNLNIVAKWYQVVVVKIGLCDGDGQFDYHEFRQVEQIVSSLTENSPDIFLLKKDLQELILIMMGESAEYLERESCFLAELAKNEIANQTRCIPIIGMGSSQPRIGSIHKSFSDALASIDNQIRGVGQFQSSYVVDKTELLKLDKTAVESYLRSGTKDTFDRFFDDYIQHLGEAALGSYIIKNYIFIDIVLATARFVKELGGDIDQVLEMNQIETLLVNITTIEQVREQSKKVLVGAVEFRDKQINSRYSAIIFRAKTYIDRHFANPDISLNQVANYVNRSPSHFSTIFSQEAGVTFRDYLTQVRIEKAKELLSTTMLRSSEISYKIGYKDPHYFSSVFKKNTGLSPIKFRLQTRAKQEN